MGTKILEKGTVSACVLDLARLFGSKKVLFVGQDMAVRDDGRYYSDDTSYSDRGAHFNSSSGGQKLPGNTQEKVLVEGRLFVYLKTFEQFIEQQPTVEYRNLARTGVKITGAPYQTYEDAIKWIGETESSSFKHSVDDLLSIQGECPNLREIYSSSYKYVQDIMELSLSAAVKTEMLPDKFSGTNYSENKTVKELLNAGGKVNDLVDSNKTFWNFLFEGKTKSELVQYRRVIRDIEFPNQNWTAIQRNKEYFWSLTEGCHWLLTKMDDFFENNLHNN